MAFGFTQRWADTNFIWFLIGVSLTGLATFLIGAFTLPLFNTI